MPILTKEQILEAIDELPASDYEEIRSLLSQTLPALSPQQERELDEAFREYEKNPDAARPWHEVKVNVKSLNQAANLKCL